MTKDGIIRMAKEAVAKHGHTTNPTDEVVEALTSFANLVAAHEREGCALLCDDLHWPWRMGDNSGPKECAEAIRSQS